MTRLARNGVWTPNARVLCVECDYQSGLKNPRWRTAYPARWEALEKLDRTKLVEQPEGDEMAKCDECHAECWVRFDVAMCQRVGLTYGDVSWEMDDVRAGFEMEQTGGMCCAATFPITNDDDVTMAVVVVTAMDGNFYVGGYKRTDEPLSEPINWDESLLRWEGPSFYAEGLSGEPEPHDVLEAMATECANKVIEFVRELSKDVQP